MGILQNTNINEKIVRWEASIAAAIVLMLNTIVTLIPDFWSQFDIPNLFFIGIILFIINVGSFALMYIIVSSVHKFFWYRFLHPLWNLEGTWSVVQTANKKPTYFRIGEVEITQNYYQIHMKATTYNIIFDITKEKFSQDLSKQITRWEGDLILSNTREMVGLYSARRDTTEVRQGFHNLNLISKSSCKECEDKNRCKCRKLTCHVSGTFCDIAITDENDQRIGQINLYRENSKYKREIIADCVERCKIFPEIVNNDFFRSKI